MGTLRARARLRALGGWAATSALLAGVALLAGPAADGLTRGGGQPTFTDLLVGGCAAVAVAAAGWLWLLTGLVAVPALVGAAPRPGLRWSGAGRGLALAICGLAVVAGTAPVAHASPGVDRPGRADRGALTGLPLPDRAVGDALLLVSEGDCLWSIARAVLGPDRDDADVARYVLRLYRLNRDVVGADPDLIHPGQELRLPGTAAP
ncbi:hypothetical protein [Nocardioides sp. YIM 152588]|uniref:LysM peptidoglycan-binding domain-containing protein n=1 Tax=Nocardioides sp. YIM 152588 TaxID=3158259 RepID=UPI0032E46E61